MLSSEMKSHILLSSKRIPCTPLADNTYAITIDANELKTEKDAVIIFLDCNNQKEIARIKLESDNVKLSANGDDIHLHIDGKLTGRNYTFLNPEGNIQLHADFSTNQKLNIKTYAKHLEYHGRIFAADALEWLAKGQVEIAAKSSVRANHDMHLCMTGLKLNGRLTARTLMQEYVEDLIINPNAFLSARELKLSAKNIKNQSTQLAFNNATIDLENDFVNYAGGMINSKILLSINANNLWNAGVINFGKNLNVTLNKLFAQGIADEKDIYEHLTNPELYSQAVIQGETAEIKTNTYMDLFGLTSLHTLNLNTNTEINLGTTIAAHNTKTRCIALDLGSDLPNIDATSKDILAFINFIQSNDYHNTFAMLLASDMGKKARPYFPFLLDTLYPLLQKNLSCDWKALLYVMSDEKLMKQIKSFHTDHKDALPLHLLFEQARDVVNSGIAQQQIFDKDKCSPFALKLVAPFLPTIKHKSLVEERFGGLHLSSHIKHKAKTSHDYGVTQIATIVSEKFNQSYKDEGLDIANEIIHRGDMLNRSGCVVTGTDSSEVGSQIEKGEICAESIKWQANDLKISGNLNVNTAFMEGINLQLRGNSKINQLTVNARDNLDIPGTNQLNTGTLQSNTLHLSGYVWLNPNHNNDPTLNTNAKTTILDKSNGIIGDQSTVIIATEDGSLEGDHNVNTLLTHAKHDLAINNNTWVSEAQYCATNNLTYGGQTVFTNNNKENNLGFHADQVIFTPGSSVSGDGNMNSEGKEVSIDGTQNIDNLIAKAENHLAIKGDAMLNNEILLSKNSIDYAASTTFKDNDQTHLLAMVADNTVNVARESKVIGNGNISAIGKDISIDGQHNITALDADGENIKLAGETKLHQEYLHSQKSIDYAATTQFKENDGVIKNQLVAEAPEFTMSKESKVTGDGLFKLKTKAATLSQVDTTSIDYEVDHLPDLIDFMMSRGIYFGIHAHQNLHVTTKDPVQFNENMSLPLSTIVEAPSIDISANIHAANNLGLISNEGNVTTTNCHVIAEDRLCIDARNSYKNDRSNLFGGKGLFIHAKTDALNIAGTWESPCYTQVITDNGDIINQATQHTIPGRFGDMQEYTPAHLIGGTGAMNNGFGVYLKAGGKVLNDASKIYSLGGNCILANRNIENLSRINRYRSYYKHWNKWNGERTTEEYSWQIESPIIYSAYGINQLTSQHGAINTSALDIFACNGNELSAEGDINLNGLVLKKVCEKKGEFFGGITHENNKRTIESNAPTIAIDHKDSTIVSSNDVNILNALILGTGDLKIRGKNVTVSAPILNHSYEEDTLSFGYKLPNLSCIPAYAMYEDMQMLKGPNDKKAAGIWNLSIDGINTFNNAMASFRNNSFTSLCNPTVEINYTHTHTKQQSQTVANNVGIMREGSLDINADNKVAFINAVPAQIGKDANIKAKQFVQRGAELKSSIKSDSEAITGGVNLNLEPTVGIRGSFSEAQQSNYQNQKIAVDGRTTVNVDEWQIEAGNLVTNELGGEVSNLSIVSPVDKASSFSASLEANTGGTLNANIAEAHSTSIAEASSIHVKKDINGVDGPHFHADDTLLEGAKITAEGVNGFETNHLTTRTVKQSSEGYAFGISTNVNEFNDAAKQVLPTANTQVAYNNYHAKQDATIYGKKGTNADIQQREGKLNSTNAEGFEVETDTHFDVNVKVPISTESVLEQTQENINCFIKPLATQQSTDHKSAQPTEEQHENKDNKIKQEIDMSDKVLNENLAQVQDSNFNIVNLLPHKYDHSDVLANIVSADSSTKDQGETATQSTPCNQPMLMGEYCGVGDYEIDALKNNRLERWTNINNLETLGFFSNTGNNNNATISKPGPITVIPVIWDSHIANDKSLSLTGHIMVIINSDKGSMAYSCEPAGCSTKPAQEYIKDQNRDGYGLTLNLSEQKAAAVADFFEKNVNNTSLISGQKYKLLSNNCGAILQDALRNVGINLTPVVKDENWRSKEADLDYDAAKKVCPINNIAVPGSQVCMSGQFLARRAKRFLFSVLNKSFDRISDPNNIGLSLWKNNLVDKDNVIHFVNSKPPILSPAAQNDTLNNPWKKENTHNINTNEIDNSKIFNFK